MEWLVRKSLSVNANVNPALLRGPDWYNAVGLGCEVAMLSKGMGQLDDRLERCSIFRSPC